jgi:hypothetical protein
MTTAGKAQKKSFDPIELPSFHTTYSQGWEGLLTLDRQVMVEVLLWWLLWFSVERGRRHVWRHLRDRHTRLSEDFQRVNKEDENRVVRWRRRRRRRMLSNGTHR